MAVGSLNEQLETLTKLTYCVHQSSMEEEAYDKEGKQRKGRVEAKEKWVGGSLESDTHGQ